MSVLPSLAFCGVKEMTYQHYLLCFNDFQLKIENFFLTKCSTTTRWQRRARFSYLSWWSSWIRTSLLGRTAAPWRSSI